MAVRFRVPPVTRRLLLLLLPLVAIALPATAAPPSPARPGASLRLVVAGVVDGRPELGLEIALEPGWKTYWRSPGDAGIPPVVDWSRSTGVAGFDLRFPTPVRFGEEDAVSIGYTEPVVLPIDLTLADRAAPATVDLDVQIGLCHDICVPLAARLTASIDPSRPVDEAARARLARARGALPVAVTADTLPRIVDLERSDDDEGRPIVSVTVREPAPSTGEEMDLLVEGPTADWSLPPPNAVMLLIPPSNVGPWRRVWAFELAGLPKGADTAAARLRFTLKAGGRGYEQTVGLDGTGLLP